MPLKGWQWVLVVLLVAVCLLALYLALRPRPLATSPPPQTNRQPAARLAELGANTDKLHEWFNANAGRPRVIAIVSPT